MMKSKMIVSAVMLMGALQLTASQQLTLKEITGGAFRAETMAAVEPLSDGETYAQISADGQQIVKYSFKTGKPLGTLFNCKTVRGPKVSRVDGYIVSPDGRHLLIQTQTKRIYRRSYTATY
jgi:dipeptidyl-peptidase-4